jgi:hypothetical protein
MSYDISANVRRANVRRTKKKDIEQAIEKVSEVLGDGTRIDRHIQINSDGSFHLTTKNVMAVQSKALPVMDEFDDEDVFHIVADAIAEAIEKANCPLLDSKNNEFIRKATPGELMDFWFESPNGYIYIDYLYGCQIVWTPKTCPLINMRKCYVQI